MENKNSKLAIIIAILFELILIFTAVSRLITGYKKNMFLFILAMACLSFPFIITYITNKKELSLPPRFQLASSLFIFSAQYLGEIIGFYSTFWWWDLFLHGISGFYLIVIAMHLTKDIIVKNEKVTTKRFLIFKAMWALSFTALIGVLWEIFEFIGDYFFNTHMVKGELQDSAADLSVKVIVALFTSIAYYLNDRKKSHVLK